MESQAKKILLISTAEFSQLIMTCDKDKKIRKTTKKLAKKKYCINCETWKMDLIYISSATMEVLHFNRLKKCECFSSTAASRVHENCINFSGSFLFILISFLVFKISLFLLYLFDNILNCFNSTI